MAYSGHVMLTAGRVHARDEGIARYLGTQMTIIIIYRTGEKKKLKKKNHRSECETRYALYNYI